MNIKIKGINYGEKELHIGSILELSTENKGLCSLFGNFWEGKFIAHDNPAIRVTYLDKPPECKIKHVRNEFGVPDPNYYNLHFECYPPGGLEEIGKAIKELRETVAEDYSIY